MEDFGNDRRRRIGDAAMDRNSIGTLSVIRLLREAVLKVVFLQSNRCAGRRCHGHDFACLGFRYDQSTTTP